MKQKLLVFFSLIFLCAAGTAGSGAAAYAAGNYTFKDLTLTQVNDIDVYNDYTINKLSIDNSLLDNQDGCFVFKITLDRDGYISLLLTARNVLKNTEKFGSPYSNTQTDASLTATVYRDSMLLYPVTQPVTAKGTAKGESPDKIALDQGTYYIAIQTDKYSVTTSNGATTFVSVAGNAELIIYYQKVPNDEIYRPSTVGKENKLVLEDEFDGLLTVTNPKDYYTFELTDKALVKINFMYSSTKTAKFVLYSPEREELLTKPLSGSNIWYNVEKYLEPGTYYCSLETVTPYDGGQTCIQINQTIYPLNLYKENDYVNTYVTVETIEAPKEIRYVLGKLTNSELTSSKWNSGKIITEDMQFGVNKNGYYTVRVMDEYGNMFMQSIKITDCDQKAPVKPSVKTYTAGTLTVSGTAEKNSLVTVTLNGRSYTCKATSKGSFKCTLPQVLMKGNQLEVTAQDISGNISQKTVVTVK